LVGSKKETAHDQVAIAGATLGGVAGVAVGSSAGFGLGAQIGLCAATGACGLIFPAAGAILGALAAKRWLEEKIGPKRVTKSVLATSKRAVSSPIS